MDYFVNKDSKKCPVTECVVRDETCSKPIDNVSVNKDSQFTVSVIKNIPDGYS